MYGSQMGSLVLAILFTLCPIHILLYQEVAMALKQLPFARTLHAILANRSHFLFYSRIHFIIRKSI
jgi:hypothetical protein